MLLSVSKRESCFFQAVAPGLVQVPQHRGRTGGAWWVSTGSRKGLRGQAALVPPGLRALLSELPESSHDGKTRPSKRHSKKAHGKF